MWQRTGQSAQGRRRELSAVRRGRAAAGELGGGPVGVLVSGLFFGWRACLQHLLLRLLLWRGDLAPLDYVRFLDYAAERVLLRKVGGGYIFLHRTLMEWFAWRWQE